MICWFGAQMPGASTAVTLNGVLGATLSGRTVSVVMNRGVAVGRAVGVGVGVGLGVGVSVGVEGEISETKAFIAPSMDFWTTPEVVGKVVELVEPATYALPVLPTAIP